jgi:transposase
MSFSCQDQKVSRRDFSYGKSIIAGCALERDRVAVSGVRTFSRRWSASEEAPGRADRDSLRAQDRNWVEGLADRSLRLLVQDLSTPPQGMVRVGLMAADARVVPRQIAERRTTRLVEGLGRLQPSEGPAGRTKTGPNPTDRGRSGSKHCLLTDARGAPLVIQLEAANFHDVNTLLPLVVEIPAVGGKAGRPKQKPAALMADKAFDSQPLRALLNWLGIKPSIPMRGDQQRGLGKHRWFIERTFSWLHQFRRLRIRWERSPEYHQDLLSLAAAIICYRMWINAI